MSNESRRATIGYCRSKTFDLVVIGGGITGCGVAREAAGRGLHTLLLEKGDFASGTSSKSGKLIHGGFRYLPHGHFKLMWEASHERQILMEAVAPHIVKPLNFLLPIYKNSKFPKWLIGIGVVVYHLLGGFRNFRSFRSLSSKKTERVEPGLSKQSCAGSFLYHDCAALDYRLVIENVKSASELGAHVLNYCKVTDLRLGSKEQNVSVVDVFTGESFSLKAAVVINATGVWADDMLKLAKVTPLFDIKTSRGVHLLLDNRRMKISHAVGLETKKDRRYFYVVPWFDKILLGTTDTFYAGDKDQIPVTEVDVNYLLEAFNAYFPEAKFVPADVKASYAGIRSLVGVEAGAEASSVSRDFEIKVHPPGLLSLAGGKLTTYRLMAKAAVDRVMKEFFKGRECRPFDSKSPLSGGLPVPLSTDEREMWTNETNLDARQIDFLIETYGSNVSKVLAYIADDRVKAERISPDMPHIWAELDYFVDYEFAETLDDVMTRRSLFFLFSDANGEPVCEKIASYVGKKLGWSESFTKTQVSSYKGCLSVQGFLGGTSCAVSSKPPPC